MSTISQNLARPDAPRWRGKFSLSRVSHSSQKTPRRARDAAPRFQPRGLPRPRRAFPRGAMAASALALARGPRLGSPRPGRASTSRPRATFRGRKSPAKRTGAGASPRRARFAPSAALFHRGVSARGADEADAIALEILTRNGVGVLEVRRERARERLGARGPTNIPAPKAAKKNLRGGPIFVGLQNRDESPPNVMPPPRPLFF